MCWEAVVRENRWARAVVIDLVRRQECDATLKSRSLTYIRTMSKTQCRPAAQFAMGLCFGRHTIACTITGLRDKRSAETPQFDSILLALHLCRRRSRSGFNTICGTHAGAVLYHAGSDR